MKLEGQQPQVNIDVMKDTSIIKCENKLIDAKNSVEYDCDGEAFDQALELRKVSALVSPTGKVGVIPVPFYYCIKCGSRVDLTEIQ